MSLNTPDVSMPAHFSGIVRLFPLPNLVLFPGVVQALHIFEPRYRKMTEDSLSADHLISICLYQRKKSTPLALEEPESLSIHQDVCVSKIVAHKELEDGRFNLLVMGVKRAKILRELPIEQPYRMAEVRLKDDQIRVSEQEIGQLRTALLNICDSLDYKEKINQHIDIKKIIRSDISLSLLVDLICFSGNLDCESKQTILELACVESRCGRLIEFLQSKTTDGGNFPANFSSN